MYFLYFFSYTVCVNEKRLFTGMEQVTVYNCKTVSYGKSPLSSWSLYGSGSTGTSYPFIALYALPNPNCMLRPMAVTPGGIREKFSVPELADPVPPFMWFMRFMREEYLVAGRLFFHGT